MRPAAALVLVLLAVAAAGCDLSGTKHVTKSGAIGDNLKGPHGLQVRLVRYNRHVAASGHDVTGLATPATGTHFVAFLVRMCVNSSELPTLSDRNFSVTLVSGGVAVQKFPQTVFADDLNLLGEAGCERGHIVFEVPRDERPADLRFSLDVDKGSTQGYSEKTRIRFTWTL